MKAALFSYGILEQGGGLETYMVDIASQLAQDNTVEIDIITLDEKYTKKLLWLLSIFYRKKVNTEIVRRMSSKSISQKIGNARYIRATSIKKLHTLLLGYDVIYSKNEVLEAAVLKFAVGYDELPPIIFGCHTPIAYPKTSSIQARIHNLLYTGRIYKFLANGVSSFHVLNSSDEAAIKKLFPVAKIYKIVNPFSQSTFDNNAAKYTYQFQFDSSKKTILWVGRMTLQKGIPDLVEIINSVNDKVDNKNLRWLIVGEGSETSLIIDSAKKWNNVHFLGQIENKYLPSIYKRSNLSINTSHWEGLPYTIREAQAANLPVIAYDIPGCNDLIANGKNGLLAPDITSFKQYVLEWAEGKGPNIASFSSNLPNTEIYRLIKDMFLDNVKKGN